MNRSSDCFRYNNTFSLHYLASLPSLLPSLSLCSLSFSPSPSPSLCSLSQGPPAFHLKGLRHCVGLHPSRNLPSTFCMAKQMLYHCECPSPPHYLVFNCMYTESEMASGNTDVFLCDLFFHLVLTHASIG